jgi:predicted GNAT family acetyltransferase
MSQPHERDATRPEVADGAELAITDNPQQHRYEARFGDVVAGWVDYGRVQSRLVALHTEVLPRFGGRGIAKALVRRVLDDARSAGVTVTPRCPLFAAHFERHPEDADLLAPRRWTSPPSEPDEAGA